MALPVKMKCVCSFPRNSFFFHLFLTVVTSLLSNFQEGTQNGPWLKRFAFWRQVQVPCGWGRWRSQSSLVEVTLAFSFSRDENSPFCNSRTFLMNSHKDLLSYRLDLQVCHVINACGYRVTSTWQLIKMCPFVQKTPGNCNNASLRSNDGNSIPF